MGPRIFISYSHKNQQQLELIVRILQKVLKADIWYDNDLKGGTSFRGDIESQIAERDFFVFLASEDSFQSPFCRKELSFAMETEKPILPIFIEDCEIPLGQGYKLALTEEHRILMYTMTEAELKKRLLHSILAKQSSAVSLSKLYGGIQTPLNRTERQQLYLKIEETLENEEFEEVTRFIGLPEVNPLFRRASREERGSLYLFLLWAERELVPSETEDFSEMLIEPFSGRNYNGAVQNGMRDRLIKANRQLFDNITAFVQMEVDLEDAYSYRETDPEKYRGDFRYLWECLLYRTGNLNTGGIWKASADIEVLRRWYTVFEQSCPSWLLNGGPDWTGIRPSGRVENYFEELDTLAARHNGAEEYEQGMALREEGNREKEAAEFLRQAAEKGHAEAQYELGLCYMVGEGVAEDLKEAGRLFRLAGEQGLMEAQRELGRCFKYGEGVDLDGAEAVQWFRRAADQGDRWAQFWTGECYNTGEGVAEDKAEAIHWFRLAADNGHKEAQYRLGRFYDYGIGVPMDKEESVIWYRKAAEQGVPDAENALGVAYAFGQGLPVDKEEGVKWYRKAAVKGCCFAQYNLAMCYDHGNGVEENKTEAMRWYKKAAEQGDEDAQYRLGIGYLRGTGVPRDEDEALHWLKLAEESGSGRAANYLKHYRRMHKAASL